MVGHILYCMFVFYGDFMQYNFRQPQSQGLGNLREEATTWSWRGRIFFLIHIKSKEIFTKKN